METVRRFGKILHVLLVCLHLGGVTSAAVTTLDDLDTELSNMLDMYYDKQSIVPVQNITTSLPVTLDLSLVAITAVGDEDNSMEISGYFTATWTEERYTAADIADDIYTVFPATAMWTPNLILVNSLSSAAYVSAGSSQLTFTFNTSGVVWQPRFTGKVACDMDLTYFPYDQQECTFTFSVLGQVQLTTAQTTVNTADYIENKEWTLVKTAADTYTVNSQSRVNYKFTIKRRPTRNLLITMIPVLLFSALHMCVFLLPEKSGERMKFSSTCLLIFAILLVILIDEIPATSDTTPYLLYYVLAMLGVNALTTLLVIMSTILGSMADTKAVHLWLALIISCITCHCYSYRKHAQTAPRKDSTTTTAAAGKAPITVSTAWDDEDDQDFVQNGKQQTTRGESGGHSQNKQNMMTWETVRNVLDVVAFIVILLLELGLTLVFMLVLTQNSP